jgi:hypothetical protein
VRNYSELFFSVMGNNYINLTVSVRPIAEALEGKWGFEGLLRREGEHFLGWDMHVGNERL